MAVLEAVQITVTLTKDKAILKQLKQNRMFKKDEQGEYLSLQFDGQEFRFRANNSYTLGKSVANSLIRSSAIIVGSDALSDPILPFLVKESESELGMSSKAKFACPLCHKDMETAPRLTRHLMTKHKTETETPEGILPSSNSPVDFDTPLEEQIGKQGDFADGGEDTDSFGSDKDND